MIRRPLLRARLFILLGLLPILATPMTQACGLHGMSFGAFGGANQLHKRKPPKPAMVALDISSVIRVAAGARGVVDIAVAEANGIAADEIKVTLLPGPAVTLESPGSRAVRQLPERLSIGFTAEEGYHMVNILISATVDGEAREFTRQIYVIAKNAEVARR